MRVIPCYFLLPLLFFGNIILASTSLKCVKRNGKCVEQCNINDNVPFVKTVSHLVPKLCQIEINIPTPCSKDSSENLCPLPTSIPDVCNYEADKIEPCESYLKPGCQDTLEVRGTCKPNSNGKFSCSHTKGEACLKGEQQIEVPCSMPVFSCDECKERSLLKKCKRYIRKKRLVPCKSLPDREFVSVVNISAPTGIQNSRKKSSYSWTSVTSGPLPSFHPNPNSIQADLHLNDNANLGGGERVSNETTISQKSGSLLQNGKKKFVSVLEVPFPDRHVFVRNLRCLASFYDDNECSLVNDFCKIESIFFDSVSCMINGCSICQKIQDYNASEPLARYCQMLLNENCKKIDLDSELRVTERVKTSMCIQEYEEESFEECKEKLHDWEICNRGCLVRKCKVCLRNKRKCIKPGNLCKISELQPTLCQRNITLQVPCKKSSCERSLTWKKSCGVGWIGDVSRITVLPYCSSEKCQPKNCHI